MRINQVYIQKLENLLTKGFKEVGKAENGLSRLIHPKTGKEVVLGEDLKLLLGDTAKTVLQNRNKAAQALTVMQKQAKTKSDILKKSDQIADNIYNIDKKNNLGLVDFSLANWRALAPGHTMTPDEIKLYTTKTLPVIEKTFKNLIKNKQLFSDSSNRIHGFRDGKEYILKTPQDVMAHIMMNTPQGKKLVWTGKAFFSGTPQKYKDSMEKYGGMQHSYTKTGKNVPTWMDTDTTGAIEYRNPDKAPGGFSAYIAPIKPSIALPYLQQLGIKPKITKVYDEPFIIHTDLANPVSNHYLNNGMDIVGAMQTPYKDIIPYTPSSFAISEKPVIDDAASKTVKHQVKGLFGIIGSDLPRKAIFGGSGQYDLTNPGLFKAVAPTIAFGGLANYLYGQNRTDI